MNENFNYIISLLTVFVGVFIFIQNIIISKTQKAEINKLKNDFERQSEMMKNIKTMLDMYDVDIFKKYQKLILEAKELEHQNFVNKLEKELKITDAEKFELVKFCIGALKDVDLDKRNEVLDLYFPKNKKQFMVYIKKANI